MDNSVVKVQGKAHRKDVLIVRFTGNSAIAKGQPLCWDFSNGRDDEVTTVTTSGLFAGVAAFAYAGVTGGQEIAIFTPGSVCEVRTQVNGTLGSLIKPSASGQVFSVSSAGAPGMGVAVLLETKNTSSAAGLTKAKLLEGGYVFAGT